MDRRRELEEDYNFKRELLEFSQGNPYIAHDFVKAGNALRSLEKQNEREF